MPWSRVATTTVGEVARHERKTRTAAEAGWDAWTTCVSRSRSGEQGARRRRRTRRAHLHKTAGPR
jgi:hypothetical protein